MLSFFIFLKPAVIPSSHLWSSLGRARSEDGSISISIGRAQSVIKNEPHFWWGGWTHVQRTRVESGLSGFRRRRQQEATNGAPGIATRSKDATNGAPRIATRNKKLGAKGSYWLTVFLLVLIET